MSEASGNLEQVLKDLRDLRADVTKLVGSARMAAVDGVDSAYEDLKLRAQEPLNSVAGYVRAQPLTGVLIALGVGYLLGGMTRGR